MQLARAESLLRGRPGLWASVAGLGACLAVASWPLEASATFPGKNGRIAYSVDLGTPDCSEVPDCDNVFIRIWRPGTGTSLQVPRRCGDDDCDDRLATWSPDGRQLLFQRIRGSRPSMVFVAPDGEFIREVDSPFAPRFSPDGRRFVFETLRLPRPCCFFSKEDLYVSRVDGSGRRRLTFNGGGEPDWSIGGLIAFARRSRDGSPHLFTIRPDGTGLRRLTYRGGGSPSWSPDGRRMVFTRTYQDKHGEQRQALAIIGQRGGRVRRLTFSGKADDENPVWSPDGRKIAFKRDFKVMTISLKPGSRPRPLGFRTSGELDWQPLPMR